MSEMALDGGLGLGAGGKKAIFQFTITCTAVANTQTISGVFRTSGGSGILHTITVDWGDGTAREDFAGTTDQAYSHNYGGAGIWVVRVWAYTPMALTKFTQTVTTVVLSGRLVLSSGLTYCDINGTTNAFSGPFLLPSAIVYCKIVGSGNAFNGSLGIPSATVYLNINGNSNAFNGNIYIPALTTYVNIMGNSNAFSGYTPSTKANNQNKCVIATIGTNGFSSTDVDEILIDYAAAGGTWSGDKIIWLDLNGCPGRTSASAAAVDTLTGKGVTVTTNLA